MVFTLFRKISENPNTTIESPSVQNCLENTIISIIDSDSDECKQKTMVIVNCILHVLCKIK